MNSVSPGTVGNRPSLQSAFACSIRSGEEDEIPPNLTRSVERLAAQQQHSSRRNRAYRGRIALTEDEHAARLEGIAPDADAALGNVDRPLLIPGRNLDAGALGERRVGVEHVRKDGERRARPIKLPGDDTDALAFPVEHRQRLLAMMRERGLNLFAIPREGNPSLYAEQPRAGGP
jgi:hypothetical protein